MKTCLPKSCPLSLKLLSFYSIAFDPNQNLKVRLKQTLIVSYCAYAVCMGSIIIYIYLTPRARVSIYIYAVSTVNIYIYTHRSLDKAYICHSFFSTDLSGEWEPRTSRTPSAPTLSSSPWLSLSSDLWLSSWPSWGSSSRRVSKTF